MKYSLRFIIPACAITALTFFQAGNVFSRASEVSSFRGAALEQDVFNPLIAKSINESGGIRLTIDGEDTTRFNGHLYVDSHMQIMGDLYFVREVFSADAHCTSGSSIRIDRGSGALTLTAGTLDAVRQDGSAVSLTTAPVLADERAFVPLADVGAAFGYSVSWDNTKLTLTVDSENAVPAVLPEAFDLRAEGRAPQIRNQGTQATCWAYAATGAIESSLLPEKDVTLSPEDMVKKKGYSFKGTDGGDYSQALAYLLSWKGPVYEGDGRTALHLQEAHVYDSDNIDEIKWAIFKNGGVSSSIYADTESGSLSRSAYYNAKKNAYCYNGDSKPNHDIVLIGWDDSFSASAFGGKANGRGAFICQNSWGSKFGDNGVFYVSYYDTNIGDQAVSYTGLEGTDNYDSIYQSDLYGWTGQIGYASENVLGANIYTASDNQELKAAGFYALGRNSFYEIYVVTDYTDTASLAKRTLVASGSLTDKGYYTIPFTNPVSVKRHSKFAVILSITTPGMQQPMAIEYTSDRMDGKVDISDGTSFISGNGLDWDSVENTSGGNLCIKAYADREPVTEED